MSSAIPDNLTSSTSPTKKPMSPSGILRSNQAAGAEKVDRQDNTIVFHGTAELYSAIRRLDTDFVVCQCVDNDAFRQICAEREARSSTIRFHYRPEDERLLITVPTISHNQAHTELLLTICYNFASMGPARDKLISTAVREFGGNGSDGHGEADAVLVPFPRSNDLGAWPTFVIESGVSQSLYMLRQKMRWWFAVSRHEVKIVLLIKVVRASRTIRLEKYIKGVSSPSPLGSLEPQLEQVVTIEPQGSSHRSNRVDYRVLGDALVLEFALLFLRAADHKCGEQDVTVTKPQLVSLAERVWTHS